MLPRAATVRLSTVAAVIGGASVDGMGLARVGVVGEWGGVGWGEGEIYSM